MAEIAVQEVLEAVPHLARAGSQHLWFDFDEEADVLYISFEKPQQATDTDPLDDDTLMRYRGEHLVGITILNVSKRFGANKH
ncbi:MAG: DUF2283 domain-containing protein [Deltaproteobacteria bacterium]|nr:DUF2283 domain-containing protein [Deltaproteobacteria bacterium]